MKNKITLFFANHFTFILTFLIIFRQSLGVISTKLKYFIAGNMNVLYLFGLVELYQNLKKWNELKRYIFILICLMCLLGIQTIFIPGVSTFKGIVNILKITLCIAVMIYFKKNAKKIELNKLLLYSTALYFILFCFAILLKNDIFWRFNDNINKLASTRLQLLFTEPSEIGLNCSPLIIISLGIFLTNKSIKILYPIPIVLLLLYFSKPMAGIMILIISIFFMLLIFFYKNVRNKKIFYLLLFCMLFFGSLLLLNQNFYIGQRILRIISGQDSSTNYRILVSFKVALQALIDTCGLGVGFSSIDNAYNVLKYSQLGLVDVGITASFFNAIAEFGLFAIIGIIILNILMINSIIKSFSYIKLGLYIFIITYQFMGTFFTNPFCWMIYGYILSKNEN